ncbi:unnamed protein product, partial [Polarella glacialis]
VLMVTDLPRLLVLDSSGRRVLHDIDLGSESVLRSTSSGAMTDSLHEPVLQIISESEFDLSIGGQFFRCRDTELGAEDWIEKIVEARERALLGRQTASSCAAGSVRT